jgi:hypothetical protein
MYLTLLLRTLGNMSKKSTILRKIIRLVTIHIGGGGLAVYVLGVQTSTEMYGWYGHWF